MIIMNESNGNVESADHLGAADNHHTRHSFLVVSNGDDTTRYIVGGACNINRSVCGNDGPILTSAVAAATTVAPAQAAAPVTNSCSARAVHGLQSATTDNTASDGAINGRKKSSRPASAARKLSLAAIGISKEKTNTHEINKSDKIGYQAENLVVGIKRESDTIGGDLQDGKHEEDLNIGELNDTVVPGNQHEGQLASMDGESLVATTCGSSNDSPDSLSNSSAAYSNGSPTPAAIAISVKSVSSTSSGGSSSSQVDNELGNKCGKCQNHEIEISKKGHARDCPFKKCNCLKCRLLDARSDILQVISGKETKLKGTKKDPNCGFCQNHGVKILRKGHVRSCGFGQERHFKLDNCFDCEVHYIRNEVNRLQIKMRRAMKEDRTLSEEQRKTAREAITRDEVEKVCDMARLARKKRENILMQQAGETSSQPKQTISSSSSSSMTNGGFGEADSGVASGGVGAASILATPKIEPNVAATIVTTGQQHTHHLNQLARQTDVWRPWSHHQVAAAMAAQQQQHHHHQNLQRQQQQQQHHQQQQQQQQLEHHQQQQLQLQLQLQQGHSRRQQIQQANNNGQAAIAQHHHQQISGNVANNQQQQLTNAATSMAAAANQNYLINSLQAAQQQQRRIILNQPQQYEDFSNGNSSNVAGQQLSPSSTPPDAHDQPLPLTQRNMQEQQLFNTLFRLIVAQFAQPPRQAH